MNRLDSLDALLKVRDDEFVSAAYRTILGRVPDADGLQYYARRLQDGARRLDIAAQLYLSPEGDAYDSQLKGLSEAMRLRRMQRALKQYAALAMPKRKRGRFPGAAGLMGAIAGVPPASTADELLARHDIEFLSCAYQTLLRRIPDPDGFAYYLHEIRRGVDRRRILAQILQSSEARRCPQLPDLKAAIWPYQLAAVPVIGPLLCFLVERVGMAQRLRAIENALHSVTLRQAGAAAAAEPASAGVAASVPVVAKRRGIVHRPATKAPVIYYFVDHTIGCAFNTGMQRVVRRLAEGLLVGAGRTVIFVKWDAQEKGLVLISRAEVDHLQRWNGPALSESERARYPLNKSTTLVLDRAEIAKGDWLLVPEVTHISQHSQDPTIDVMMAAKRLGLALAYVYYDAIPLRLPDYAETCEVHEKYMQALLLADIVFPISEYSGRQLELFFRQRQRAQLLPLIQPIPLPGEVNSVRRETEAAKVVGEKRILCVGSIDMRKNQMKLASAFDAFSQTPGGKGWRLVLAGHVHPALEKPLRAVLERNRQIQWVPHPSDEELAALYRLADFTVFPSFEEGFGLPILESLWYGKPCICADFGAMGEVAREGGCLTVNTREVAEIEAALVRLTGEPELLRKLSSEAVARPISSWIDYGRAVDVALRLAGRPSRTVASLYFCIDPAPQAVDSGLRRLTDPLARSLMAAGTALVPALWDGRLARLAPLSAEDLRRVADRGGLQPGAWAEWVEPGLSGAPNWLLVADVPSRQANDIVTYAHDHGLRSAAVFHGDVTGLAELPSDERRREYEDQMQALADCDKIFASSEAARQDFYDFLLGWDARTHTVDHRLRTLATPNEFPGAMRPARPKTHESGPVNFLVAGALDADEGAAVLLNAFDSARRRSSRPVRLTVVGSASGKPNPEAIRANVEQAADCTWIEPTGEDQLQQLYSEADVTIVPMLRGAADLPISESLWHGRPVIIHGAGSRAELVAGGGCLPVDMRDADALADAIVALSGSDALRHQLAAEALARPVRRWDEHAAELLADLASDRPKELRAPAIGRDDSDVLGELPNLRPRPTLSLCISTYNRAGWLGVNLANLFSGLPSPNPEIEVLVVDNASADNTVEVVRPYLQRSDFRFVRNPKNVGMLGNLTVTAHAARGEYVWILGDDDLLRKGALEHVLKAIHEHPDVAVVYPNYAFTYETNFGAITDVDAFLESCPPVVPPSDDQFALVKQIATKNENLFTAIYALILRRDHALQAYSQDTSGRPFSTMRTAIPSTYYALNYMMEEPGYWIGAPILVVNFNVSWNKYATLFILERFTEAHDLAERMGADPDGIDVWRLHQAGAVAHFWREMFDNDPEMNFEYFSPERIVMRLKGREKLQPFLAQMAERYAKAYADGHPSAVRPPEDLFRSINLGSAK